MGHVQNAFCPDHSSIMQRRWHFTGAYLYAIMMRQCGACRHIKGLMRKAGLAIREDAMGNIFGRWQGFQPGAGAAHTRYSSWLRKNTPRSCISYQAVLPSHARRRSGQI